MLKKKNIIFIFFMIMFMLLIVSSCKKENYILVETNAMTADISRLPEKYQSYEIKPFKAGDYVLLEEIHSYNVNQLEVGDVVQYYDEGIQNYLFKRIIYIVRNWNDEIENISLQGDQAVSNSGLYDPNDDTNVNIKYYLERSGAVIILTKSSNTLRNLKGKVIKVKYEAKSDDEW